ncbi:MAG: hypothetical protein A3C55_03505 [Gammaproteobacteria bacterium RIFCSPHIGHO2_02_FULL_42_13]|nr:MAG: hypothetical protein A3C55_03505 [Gammaproteobacteria bacterium RIFCSPHIGHO2_02_FULL_42_13]
MKRQFVILASMILSWYNVFADNSPNLACIQPTTSGYFVSIPVTWGDLPSDFITCKTDSSGNHYCTLSQTMIVNAAGEQLMFQSVSPDVCYYGPFTFKTEMSNRTIFGVTSLKGKVTFSVNGQALELVVTPDGTDGTSFPYTLDFSSVLPQIGYCNPAPTSDHKILCCKDNTTPGCGVV